MLEELEDLGDLNRLVLSSKLAPVDSAKELFDVVEGERSINSAQRDQHIVLANCDTSIAT